MKIRTKTATTNKTFTILSHGGPHVGVLSHFPNISTPPFSLYIASKEPVRVIQPTNADKPAATIVTVSSSPVGNVLASLMYLVTSESATKARSSTAKTIE